MMNEGNFCMQMELFLCKAREKSKDALGDEGQHANASKNVQVDNCIKYWKILRFLQINRKHFLQRRVMCCDIFAFHKTQTI